MIQSCLSRPQAHSQSLLMLKVSVCNIEKFENRTGDVDEVRYMHTYIAYPLKGNTIVG